MTSEKDTYKTIKIATGDAIFKEKGSKFIGYVYPITSEDDVKIYLDELKKKHHTARHWCYAWQLGVEEVHYRANDDGEPNNSAGQPIYGQILSKEITNVLVVVVRYFGGTKFIDVYFQLIFEYQDMNKVMRIVKEQELNLIQQKMELNCEFLISVRKKNADKVKQLFLDLRCVKIKEINP